MDHHRPQQANPPQALASCFIRLPGSDKLRITATGRELFAQRFARQGINIDTIKTVRHFLLAQHRVLCAELNAIRWDKDTEPGLKEILNNLLD